MSVCPERERVVACKCGRSGCDSMRSDSSRPHGHGTVCTDCDAKRRNGLRASNREKWSTADPYAAGERVCSDCRQPKPLRDFRRHGGNSGGLELRCRRCADDRRLGHGLEEDDKAETRAAVEQMRQDRMCAYCGASAVIEIDHLEPRHLGGTDHTSNLLPACRSCNASKSNQPPAEWLPSRVYTLNLHNADPRFPETDLPSGLSAYDVAEFISPGGVALLPRSLLDLAC